MHYLPHTRDTRPPTSPPPITTTTTNLQIYVESHCYMIVFLLVVNNGKTVTIVYVGVCVASLVS